MIRKFSAYKENGNRRPAMLINSALRELGVNGKISDKDTDLIPTFSDKKYNTLGFKEILVKGLQVRIEYECQPLYLDDEDFCHITGVCSSIIRISTSNKSMGGLDIAINYSPISNSRAS